VTKRDIVVIGGSAGSIQPLLSLVSALPSGLAASILIVVHISPDSPGALPEILSRRSRLPVLAAGDGERFLPGHIYIAPSNRHLLIDDEGFMRLTLGPKENRVRPAIDPLFRSAALGYGPRVAGVVLSGALDDGTSGLGSIKDKGGFAVVQDPREAEVPSMPLNALRHVEIDRCVPIREMPAMLVALADGKPVKPIQPHKTQTMPHKELEIEVRLAQEREGFRTDFLELGSPSMLTCPECHGTLLRLNDQKMLRFRCHTGHAYTAATLLAAIKERIEEALWTSVSAIEESAMLLGHMAEHIPSGDDTTAADFRDASQDALRSAQAVRGVITAGQSRLSGSAEGEWRGRAEESETQA
jgi:two-component system chemotaxis response regulator CheB